MGFSKGILSESVDGRQILVSATGSTGTTLHSAIAGTGFNNLDEIYIYAANNDSTDTDLTIQWGGTGPAHSSTLSVPALSGFVLVVPGFVLQNGGVISAYASTSDKIVVNGYVNRIEPDA